MSIKDLCKNSDQPWLIPIFSRNCRYMLKMLLSSSDTLVCHHKRPVFRRVSAASTDFVQLKGSVHSPLARMMQRLDSVPIHLHSSSPKPFCSAVRADSYQPIGRLYLFSLLIFREPAGSDLPLFILNHSVLKWHGVDSVVLRINSGILLICLV